MANYLFPNQFCKSLKVSEQVQKYKLGWFFAWTDTFANFSYGKFQVVETLLQPCVVMPFCARYSQPWNI